MTKKLSYEHTVVACFIGYIVQAIVNNFIPLLFVMFNESLGIPLGKITLLITFNFVLQIAIDLIAITFVDRIGYRVTAIIAHAFAFIGLVMLTILPYVFSDPFIGILISVTLYALGGGLIEVVNSPIVEACPTKNKEKAMSLLHSFYSWGYVAVVLLSTVFFKVFGIENWRIMALIWALVPLLNMFFFARVPIAPLVAEGEKGMSVKEVLKSGLFWLFMLLMFCAGSSEQSVAQWASTFAEKGLGVSKMLGDLLGPMMFAVFMGIARTIYGKFGDKIDLKAFMIVSACLTVVSYLLIGLTQNPVFGLIGCALCGFSVGIMWPGTFSLASASLKGGTAMFAFFALAGDLGCAGGPTIVGMIASYFNDSIAKGVLFALVFPILMILGVLTLIVIQKKSNTHSQDQENE